MIAGLFFFLSACNIPPGQIKKEAAPGQIRKTPGKNPVSLELGGQIELKGEYNHGVNK